MQKSQKSRDKLVLFLELGVCMRRVGDDDDVNDDVNDDDGEFVRVTFT